ncbi:MAG: hypothetical protein KAI16_02155 [Candidatus Pacebacteria bacterium]|nr:hypothetical protein [Candidatus Paceibacterota bacterium]
MKKIIKILILIFLFNLIILTFFIYKPFLDNKNIKEVINASEVETHEYFKNKVQQYEVMKCEFTLKDIKHVFVYEEKFEGELYYGIEFYNLKRDSIFSQELTSEYIGGTTIKNTTFPELLKMVKEDCEQFQKPRGHANDKIINWRWSSYNKEEEELEKKQREKEQKENLRQMRAESEMTDEEWNEFIKKIKAEQEKKGIFVDYSL